MRDKKGYKMKMAHGILAAAIFLGGGAAPAGEATGAKPRKEQATQQKRAAAASKQSKWLESMLPRFRAGSDAVDRRFGRLKSAEAQAEVDKLRTLYADVIKDVTEQIELAKQGKPITFRQRYGIIQRRITATEKMLGLYVPKEIAQAVLDRSGDDTDATVNAENVVQLCDKMIANERRIAELQAEQDALQRQLTQARRQMYRPRRPIRTKGTKPSRGKNGEPEQIEM